MKFHSWASRLCIGRKPSVGSLILTFVQFQSCDQVFNPVKECNFASEGTIGKHPLRSVGQVGLASPSCPSLDFAVR